MNLPARFLIALAQTFSAMTLYSEGHPARERALDGALNLLRDLQTEDPGAEFTFLGSEVIYRTEPLWELREWGWAERFSAIGVERIFFDGTVHRDDLDAFLDEMLGLLSGTPRSTAESRPNRPTAIRYGLVKLQEEEGEVHRPEVATATLGFTLREEVETVEWIHEELKSKDELHLLEAEAIVRSLSVAMHGDQQFLIPLLQLKRFDQYTTTHALNVSILGMALAEYIGLTPAEVRSFGISGLLHDLGKTRVPDEILNKPGKLTEQERAIMNSHTVEGARIIMETNQQLDLAAVVAYEHHIRIDGGGYPKLTYHRHCHQCSNLIHLCDVYDALRTNRPYREAWEHDRVMGYIQEGAGVEFEPELTVAFVRMMEAWAPRLRVIHDEDEAIPMSEGEPAAPPSGEGPPALRGAEGSSGTPSAEGTTGAGADPPVGG